MTTTVEAVHRHLRTDPIVHGALDRGILNVRQAARWLIEANNWDTTEEAVVSALRRYEPPESYDLETSLHLLQSGDFTARTGLSGLTFPRVREHLAQMRSLIKALDPADMLVVIPERKETLVVIESSGTDHALSLLGPLDEIELQRDLGIVEIHLPERGGTASTAFAIVLNLLSYHGLEPLGVFGALPTGSLLTEKEHFLETHNVVAELLESGRPAPDPD